MEDMTDSCEHINGTKVDENCNAYFDIIFNETSHGDARKALDLLRISAELEEAIGK